MNQGKTYEGRVRDNQAVRLPQEISRTEFSDVLTNIRLLLEIFLHLRPLNNRLDQCRLVLYNALQNNRPARKMEFQLGQLKFVTENQNGLGMISVRHFEPAVWRFMSSQRGTVFVDVGASVGGYSISLASRFKVVVAVEPSEEARRILFRNAELNRVLNLLLVPRAVSSKPGVIKLFHSRQLVNYSTVNPGETYSLVDTISLDDLLAPYEAVDLLKVDVEGAELDVIESGLNLISRANKVIVEVRSRFESRIVQLMSERGFESHVLENRVHVGEKNILFVRGNG